MGGKKEMKKKIIGIFVCMLLIMVSALNVLGSNIDNISNIIEEKDCNCNLYTETTNAFPLMNENLKTIDPAELSPKPTSRSDLPEYFNWMDYEGQDWTTPANDIRSCGGCWVFAALGALESNIQIREGCAALNLDLSEQYVISCLPRAGSCLGGWADEAFRLIKSNKSTGNYCNGIIPEFCFPYQANDDVPCANASPDWKDFLIPISTYGAWVPDGSIEDRNAIKTQIMESGPVVATMQWTYYPHGPNNLEKWGWEHHDSTDFYANPGPAKTDTHHQDLIVGWKDDSSITNGGYWIVKECFGEEWGYNGHFNLEYGALRMDSLQIIWVDYNPAEYSNWIPVAQINGSTQGHPNQEMIFNGGESFDHEGNIVSYVWDLGDGSSKTGSIITHSYASQGIYPVTLTVTDNSNNTDSETTWVYIDTENHPPEILTLKGSHIGKTGTIYSYTFSAMDPDGDDTYYYLNWGDTYWFGGGVGWIGPYGSGQEITLEKTYAKQGNYIIRVKAIDRYEAKSDWATYKVIILNSKAFNTPMFLHKLVQLFPFFEKILNQLF